MKKIITVLMLLLYSIGYGQNSLTDAEYFIDHDPGYGNATTIPLTGDTIFVDEIILNNFELGLHTFYMRVKDENDVWGMAEAVPFLIRQPIDAPEYSTLSAAEYFFDHDPGFGLATPISISLGDTALINELIPTVGQTEGVNSVSLRVRNEDGKWGISQSIEFYIRKDFLIPIEKIAGFEYFIDEDPGVGSGIFHAQIVADTVLINEYLESQVLSDGVHKLGIRIQSDSGTWGLREWVEFEHLNCIGDPVAVSGEEEFCEESTVSLSLPESFDSYYWNTHENNSLIETGIEGEYFGIVYDSILNVCSLSDTLLLEMFIQPDPNFTFTSSFSTIEAFANAEGQSLFWQINDEFSSIEESFTYDVLNDGWQNICLEASNVCGTETLCDSVLTCEDYETPPYWYLDADEDGYGIESDSVKACEMPTGYADNIEDCDDNDNTIYPGATEIPNDGIDQDCDGLDLVTGINEIGENIYHFYPNPANEVVHLYFSIDFTGSLVLFDASGKKVLETQSNNETEIHLNIENINPGIYYLEICNEDDRTVDKLIIQ